MSHPGTGVHPGRADEAGVGLVVRRPVHRHRACAPAARQDRGGTGVTRAAPDRAGHRLLLGRGALAGRPRAQISPTRKVGRPPAAPRHAKPPACEPAGTSSARAESLVSTVKPDRDGLGAHAPWLTLAPHPKIRTIRHIRDETGACLGAVRLHLIRSVSSPVPYRAVRPGPTAARRPVSAPGDETATARVPAPGRWDVAARRAPRGRRCSGWPRSPPTWSSPCSGSATPSRWNTSRATRSWRSSGYSPATRSTRRRPSATCRTATRRCTSRPRPRRPACSACPTCRCGSCRWCRRWPASRYWPGWCSARPRAPPPGSRRRACWPRPTSSRTPGSTSPGWTRCSSRSAPPPCTRRGGCAVPGAPSRPGCCSRPRSSPSRTGSPRGSRCSPRWRSARGGGSPGPPP